MEEPTSPVTSHMLPMQMQPTLLHSGSAASPLASHTFPPAPDIRLLPQAAKTSLDPCGPTRPRHCFLPSSLQHPSIGKNSSFKENNDGNEDDTRMMEQCVLTNDPSPKVDCHFFSPPSNNWDSQPITPSPHSSSTLHDNSSGWRAPQNSLNSNRFASSNEFVSEGKRLGYDGTTQTPSIHLLKPTTSSLGHRVQKVVQSQVQLSSPGSFHSSRLDSPRIGVNVHDDADLNTPVFGGNRVTGGHVTKMTIDTSTLDPFEKLNNSNDAASDDDEDMANMTYNSSDLLLDFEFDVEPTEEEGIDGRQLYHIPGSGRDSSTPPGSLHPPRPGFHRCSSWSPGSKTTLSQRLRSHNIDPVASQLLRACLVQEEEQKWNNDQDPLSSSSHDIGRIPKAAGASSWDDAALCHSPIPPSDNGNVSFSASMPDLLGPIPSALKNDRGGSKDTPMIAEESIDYSLSPVPLFRDVSDSLLDVKTEDDIKCLPRPVPRKFSMPTIAASPSRRVYFPRRSYA